MGARKQVREAKDIAPPLRRAREAITRTGKSAVVNRNDGAPVTKNETMYK
jgi:acetolactate synthase-1/2/3 large subunit